LFSKNKVELISSLDTLSRCLELFQITENNNKEAAIASIYFANVRQQLKSQLKTKKRWIYNVNPVSLYPDMDQLILASDLSEQMSDSELSEITRSINDLFSESDYDKSWELVYFAKKQWFLLSDFQLINQAIPKDKIGKPLSRPDSSDDASNYWIQTLNEIQMLLFSLPLNQQRINESRQQCNSLWIWGESFLIEDTAKSNSKKNNHWDKVYSHDYLVQQLALYRGQKYQGISTLDSLLADETSTNSLLLWAYALKY